MCKFFYYAVVLQLLCVACELGVSNSNGITNDNEQDQERRPRSPDPFQPQHPSNPGIKKSDIKLKLVEGLKFTRMKLLSENKTKLEPLINGMKDIHKDVFSMALTQYETKVIKAHENESIEVLRNDAVDQAVSDFIVDKIFPTEVLTVPDWMHYHDNNIIDSWTVKNAIVSYLDYANASLGGGAFGHGWVQEEQMVAFCAEFALLLAQESGKWDESDLTDIKNINFVTRSTRNTDKLSPRPKYLLNLRCGTGTKVGTTMWTDKALLENNDSPPAINIIAAATVNLTHSGPYALAELLDLFNNIYRAFELVAEHQKKANPGKANVIYGGRIGAGVFGQSVSMTTAMQILAAKIIGIEHLVLTGQQGAKGSKGATNIYKVAEDAVEAFLTKHSVSGKKIEDILKEFLGQVSGDSKWHKLSDYK